MFFPAHGTTSILTLYHTDSWKAEGAWGTRGGEAGGRKKPAETAELREGRQAGRGQASTGAGKPGQWACQGLTHYCAKKRHLSTHSVTPCPGVFPHAVPMPVRGHCPAPRRKLTGLPGYFESLKPCGMCPIWHYLGDLSPTVQENQPPLPFAETRRGHRRSPAGPEGRDGV